ncbi:hypothetical protein D3C80_966030 [compost metagenome]
MLPSAVRGPVFTTSPRPCPATTRVPANNRAWLSSPEERRPGSAAVDPHRVTGADSPVRRDSSTVTTSDDSSRTSAGTRSPSPMTTRSPGVSSRAGIRRSRPARITFANGWAMARSAFSALSLRASWLTVSATDTKDANASKKPSFLSPRTK